MIKRIASFVTAVAMIVGISAMAIGAPAITGVEDGVFVSSLSYENDAYQPGAVITASYEDYRPGDTINIYLNPAKFTGAGFTPDVGMSIRELENAGIRLQTTDGKNSNLIQTVSFQEQTLNGKTVAFIQIKLTSNFTETESREFERTISLLLNKQKAKSVKIGGTLANDGQEIDSGDTYIFLGDGTVVTASENIQKIEVDTGNKVFIHGRMFKGKQYYAVSDINPATEDMDLLNKYPELEMIVNLKTRGFDASNPEVKIDLGETLFAYDAQGKLLGKTNERLTLATKYYLASKEIDFKADVGGTTGESSSSHVDSEPADEGELPEGDSGAPEIEPETDNGTVQVGGGDSDIPDTGINTGLKVAIGAGIVSVGALVIIAATSRKKED